MEKLCVFCRNMYWDNSEPDWSELTPGCDFTCGCSKNETFGWSINGEYDSLEGFREAILNAQKCPDYSPVGG